MTTLGISAETNVDIVTRLFSAAHWQVGQSDYVTYEAALEDLPNEGADEARGITGELDALALAAAKEIIATIDPTVRRYSPALLRETVYAIQRRLRADQKALPEDTSPVADPEATARGLADVRAALAKARGPLADDLRSTVRTPNKGDR
jgi:hypothetical protein